MNPIVRFLQHFYYSALHKDKHEWEIIFYCIGTAFLFWFLNAMGKTYHHNIAVPVKYAFDSRTVLPVSSLPSHIEASVEGRGWDIARQIWAFEPRSFVCKLDKPLETEFVVPGKWKAKVNDLLPAVKVEGIATDTIFLRFDRIEKKLVGLYVDLQDIKLKPGFQISSPILITPKFIEFKGAASLIRTLPSMIPVKMDARNIADSFDKNVALDFSEDYPKSDLLQYDQDAVNIQFSVRPTLEEEMQVPVQVGQADLYPNLVLKERKVLLTFLISENDKKRLKPDDFVVVADMNTFNPADSTVKIILKQQPAFVSDVQLGTEKTRVYAR